MKLYELTRQFKELEDLDDPEIPAEVLADTLEALQGDIEQKAVAVAQFLLNLDATADAIEDAAKRMKQRANAARSRVEQLRAYLLFNMQATDIKKISCPLFVISRRQSPYALVITDESSVPAEFWITPPPPPMYIDKAKLKDTLMNERDVPGCHLERGEHLNIKL